jgi:iron complex outermembrane receptor protein
MKTFLLLYLFASCIYAQFFKISGIVVDSTNNEGLHSANVFLQELKSGTSTDETGKFSMVNIPEGTYTLIISYLGYNNKKNIIEEEKFSSK